MGEGPYYRGSMNRVQVEAELRRRGARLSGRGSGDNIYNLSDGGKARVTAARDGHFTVELFRPGCNCT